MTNISTISDVVYFTQYYMTIGNVYFEGVRKTEENKERLDIFSMKNHMIRNAAKEEITNER